MANQEHLDLVLQGKPWQALKNAHVHNNIHLDLSGVDLAGKDLHGIPLNGADLSGAKLTACNLSRTSLTGARLKGANLEAANLEQAVLAGADLTGANLVNANLAGADLTNSTLERANLAEARFHNAVLKRAKLLGAYCPAARFVRADLSGSDLRQTYMFAADFTEANLIDADLSFATLVGTALGGADMTGASIYGISAWDVALNERTRQLRLRISKPREPAIAVDDLEVAQFIYLILHNEKIRDVINTLTSKSVLILGRFSVPERKAILDALRDKLREYNLLPVVFDFDRPIDKDFTETIKTLAGLSYFVIADVTNPKSLPLELQATVPDYQIPFVPIIQAGEQPFAMMANLQTKYNWVLDTLSYGSADELVKALKPAIIDPAVEKHNELRLIKAWEPKIRSAGDFIEDKGLGS